MNPIHRLIRHCLTGLMLMLLIPLVSAFGVTSPYWDTKPLSVHPGETLEFTLVLQNMVGGNDMALKAVVVDGAKIAQLTDANTVYQVPFGSNDVKVNVRVTVPNTTDVGEIDRIGVAFTQVTTGKGEMVQLGAAVKTNIPVVIEPPPVPLQQPFPTGLIAVIALVLIILAVVVGIFFWRRKASTI